MHLCTTTCPALTLEHHQFIRILAPLRLKLAAIEKYGGLVFLEIDLHLGLSYPSDAIHCPDSIPSPARVLPLNLRRLSLPTFLPD
eukprot:1736092-Pleurochrysis_carterae.AAC.1